MSLELQRKDSTESGRSSPMGAPQEDGDISAVIPDFLFLGSAAVAADKDKLQKFKITHVLNTAWQIPNVYPDDFTYRKLHLADKLHQPILDVFDEAYEFIDSAAQGHGRVFVHCIMGHSRSTAMVLAYIMKSQRLSLKDALAYVRQKRPVVKPNRHFLEELGRYEQRLFGSSSLDLEELWASGFKCEGDLTERSTLEHMKHEWARAWRSTRMVGRVLAAGRSSVVKAWLAPSQPHSPTPTNGSHTQTTSGDQSQASVAVGGQSQQAKLTQLQPLDGARSQSEPSANVRPP